MIQNNFATIAKGIAERTELQQTQKEKAVEDAKEYWNRIWEQNGKSDWEALLAYFKPFTTPWGQSEPFYQCIHDNQSLTNAAWVRAGFQVRHSNATARIELHFDLTRLTWSVTLPGLTFIPSEKPVVGTINDVFVAIVTSLLQNPKHLQPDLLAHLRGE